MAAKKKSASRRPAAKAKSKTAKRPVAKKTAGGKSRSVAKKAAPGRKTRATAAKTAPRKARPPRAVPSPALIEIDNRIAIVRANLRQLAEQAAGTSGSATEELLSERIASQEAELQRLSKERDALAKGATG